MKIFLPFQKELNPYLDEIITYSEQTFIYDNYLNYNSTYDIVNIHWPEAIFNWQEPTTEELEELERKLLEWKKNSIIVYTKHDFQRNKGTTKPFDNLFKLVEKMTDVFLHLGMFSENYYKIKYPDAIHEILAHPLYEHLFREKAMAKNEAREILNIPKESIVIIVPGKIRSLAEKKLLLKTFGKLKNRRKVLIATNMRSELEFNFRGRTLLKRIFDVRKYVVTKFKKKHQPPSFYFTYEKLTENELALKTSAADIVFIPRIMSLNSGMVFLGLTFNKVVVGPSIGNIEEHLKFFNFPTYKSGNTTSATKALEDGIELIKKQSLIPEKKLIKYQPLNVTREMDKIFRKIGK